MSSSRQHDEEENEEGRFSHLLQPIRDLAKNWDIDIATALEDYLEELDSLQISLDGGRTNLNFAEAALLIQGTACIYSRKVEYLHSLVFQVLDRLTQQQQNGGAASNNNKDGSKQRGDKEGGDDDEEEGGGVGDVFLLLDDVIEEGRDIDLKEQATRPQQQQSQAGGKVKQQQQQQQPSQPQQRASFCRPPLLSLEDHGNSFKVSTCTVHKSGALIMEEGLAKELEGGRSTTSSQQQPPLAPAGGSSRQANDDDDDDFDGGGGNDWGGGGDDYYEDDDSSNNQQQAAAPHDGLASSMAVVVEEGDYAAPTPMVGMSAAAASTPPAAGKTTRASGEDDCPPTSRPSLAGTARRELRTLHSRQQQQQQGEDEDDDPWLLLDPHDPGKTAPKPFKKARPPRPPSTTTSSKEVEEEEVGGGGGVLSLSGLTLVGELGPLLKALEKMRKSSSKAAAGGRSRQRQAGGLSLYTATTLAPGEAQGSSRADEQDKIAQEARAMEGQEDDEDDDGGGGNDWGGGGGDDYYDDYDDEEQEAQGSSTSAYQQQHEGGGGRRPSYAPMSLEDAFTDAPTTYEDLCRQHIDSFMRGLEAFAHETQLTRRVADWQDKVEPLLEVQEKRGAFDIHRYGDEIIGTLANAPANPSEDDDDPTRHDMDSGSSEDGQADSSSKVAGSSTHQHLGFDEMVSGKEPFEICRMFLASLQLVNNGNLKVVVNKDKEEEEEEQGGGASKGRRRQQQRRPGHDHDDQEEGGITVGERPFELELLTADRMHERFTGEGGGGGGEDSSMMMMA